VFRLQEIGLGVKLSLGYSQAQILNLTHAVANADYAQALDLR
jgi:hypothetical protein